MKKTLIITLIDDRVIERDFTTVSFKNPDGTLIMNAPANDQGYAQFCQMMAMSGCTDPDQTNEQIYTHIAASQIKTVAFKIDK